MQSFKNIIFDFGGVIIDIDYQTCISSFRNIGIKDFEYWYSQLKQSHLFDDLETGKITPEGFRENIRKSARLPLTDEQIDFAWNSILIGLPKENIELLKKLKPHYRLFLLSNTNAIHEKAFTQMIQRDFDENVLEELFEQTYFSHHIHMRKPDEAIFQYVLRENNIKAEETLFIDDSPQHIEGAKKAGLQTVFLEKGKKITELF